MNETELLKQRIEELERTVEKYQLKVKLAIAYLEYGRASAALTELTMEVE